MLKWISQPIRAYVRAYHRRRANRLMDGVIRWWSQQPPGYRPTTEEQRKLDRINTVIDYHIHHSIYRRSM